MHAGLPADAALPGQRAARRCWRRLVGVVKFRTFEVQKDLGHTTTQGKYARLCTLVDTRSHPITTIRSSILFDTPNHDICISNMLVFTSGL